MRNRKYLIILFICLVSCGQITDDDDVIREILRRQTSCWNEGDLECFMNGYWKSDQLMFIGSKGLTYGWQATLENYKKGYPDKESMGILLFTILELISISPDAYFCVGKWHLTRTNGNLEGHFSLLWRKIDGEWVIVADHSS